MFTKNNLIKSIFVIITLFSLTVSVPQIRPFQGLSKDLGDTKLARIRIVNGVSGVPLVDVYFNGKVVDNGGVLQQNLGVGVFSGWVYVNPGTYTVALVPYGKTIEQPLFTPVAVYAAAGHRYTVAAMGQLIEKRVEPLVIDETALEASSTTKATDAFYLFIDNLKGTDSLRIKHDGALMSMTQYGEVSSYSCPSYIQQMEQVWVTGDSDFALDYGLKYCHPGASTASIAFGALQDGSASISNDSQGTSETNVLNFLAGFNSHPTTLDDGSVLTFNILLAAIDKAGMRDLFSNQDPYLFIAPTDAAFTALPEQQLDALVNDPQQLTKLIKAYFIPGYYPFGNIDVGMNSQTGREVTNLLGQKIIMTGYSINGVEGAGPSYTVGDGNRVQFISQLLP